MELPDIIKEVIDEISYFIHGKQKIFGAYLVVHIEDCGDLFSGLNELSDKYDIHKDIQTFSLYDEMNRFNNLLNVPMISDKLPDIIFERAENIERLAQEGYGPEVHAYAISLNVDRKDFDQNLIDMDHIATVQEEATELLENSNYLYLSFD